jgi:hypothetical protein
VLLVAVVELDVPGCDATGGCWLLCVYEQEKHPAAIPEADTNIMIYVRCLRNFVI